ncbi:Uu.00g077100.m01.CDS01 [Anthostomella pinea]|uniref:Uu.00g077100.m01.CDS01 n=1 Tax=Anthostomella pinea TaxID=933095 RepID=A0AAI8VWK9_9PEZI|nr:Uu.00g077100.m01.CDS01 [Anthostomella pinea]
MRLGVRPRAEQFGNVQINELLRVIELDSGPSSPANGDIVVAREALTSIETQMAIVIPCMNEDYRTIEGVLLGIPHDCLVILVSNSSRSPVDRYEAEVRLLDKFCADAQRYAIALHQNDGGAAAAFEAAGMPDLVCLEDGQRKIRKGKGEAMIMGIALCQIAKKKWYVCLIITPLDALTLCANIGFIDADNYVPGSVHEYCKVFAAGLYAAVSPRSMVRIAWNSKPKVRNNRLFFDKKGRSSKVVNEWLNRLLQERTGFGTDLIQTGNAGEHAFSMRLGLELRFATGYAIEPYEIINILEKFSGAKLEHQSVAHNSGAGSAAASSSPGLVQIFQTETQNPHFHDASKGEDHVLKMQMQGLNAIYHSPLINEPLRAELRKYMMEQGELHEGEEPTRERVYPPVGSLDFEDLAVRLSAEAASLRQVDGRGTEANATFAFRQGQNNGQNLGQQIPALPAPVIAAHLAAHQQRQRMAQIALQQRIAQQQQQQHDA